MLIPQINYIRRQYPSYWKLTTNIFKKMSFDVYFRLSYGKVPPICKDRGRIRSIWVRAPCRWKKQKKIKKLNSVKAPISLILTIVQKIYFSHSFVDYRLNIQSYGLSKSLSSFATIKCVSLLLNYQPIILKKK